MAAMERSLAVRAVRHLHPPLQHRPDRRDAGALPRRPARPRRPDRSTPRSSASVRRAVLPGGAGPVAAVRHPVRPLGHHRVMLFGPVFGAIAVVLTGPDRRITCSVLGGDARARGRLDGRQRPSILGFIALATAGNELLRGKAAARFEGATLAGLGVGVRSSASSCSSCARARRPSSSTPRLRRLVPDLLVRRQGSGRRGGGASPATHVRRRPVPRARPDVARLAARADLDRGQRGHRRVAQPVALPVSQGRPALPGPGPDAPASPPTRSRIGGDRHRGRLRRRPAVLGQPVQDDAPDDDHPLRRPRRGRARGRGPRGQPPVGGLPIVVAHRGAASPRSACSCSPGATPAALGPAGRHVRALPGRSRRDHGPVLGLPRHRPDHRRLIGGVAADWRGIDGMLIATLVLLAIALVPLAQLRSAGAPARQAGAGRPGRARRRHDRRPAVGAGPGRPGAATARSSRRTTSRRAAGLAILRAGGSAVDAAIATNAVLGVVMPSSCGLGGDAFWLIWDAAAGRQVALNGSGRARPAPTRRAPRRAGHERSRCAGRWPSPCPARSARGPMPMRGSAGCRGGRSWPRPSSWPATASRHATRFVDVVERTAPLIAATTRAATPRSCASTGRSAGPGGRASASATGARRRPSRRWPATGFDAFYEGDLGERQARGLDAAGCPITVDDLRDHASTWTDPIAIDYRGVRVTTHPPNSSGRRRPRDPGHPRPARATAARGVRPGRGRPTPAGSTLGIEAAKLAMADRDAHLTDPAFRDIPVDAPARPGATPPSSPRGSTRAAPPARPRPTNPLGGGTIYLAVVDARRQRGQPHRVELLRDFGSGVRRPGHRHPLPEPGQLLQPRPGAPERPRARQADAPHAAPRDAVP